MTWVELSRVELTWLYFCCKCFNFPKHQMECCALFSVPIFPLSSLLSWTPDHTVSYLNIATLLRCLCSYSLLFGRVHTYVCACVLCVRVFLWAVQYVLLRNSLSMEIQSNDLPIFFYCTTVIKFYHFEIQSIMHLNCKSNRNSKKQESAKRITTSISFDSVLFLFFEIVIFYLY